MTTDTSAREERAAWLRLTLTPGIGPVAVRKLLEAFGLPQQVLAQPGAALSAVLDARRTRALLEPDPMLGRAVEDALAWAEAPGRSLLTLADARYPTALLHTHDPPPLLYVEGDAGALAGPAVAIVGSRNATRGGCDTAARFARALAEAGLTVVSGLARGIDAAAHLGALGTPAGTVAVMGTGMDRIYPPEHARLAARIAAEGGAVVTEAPLRADSLPARFPRRNRIIAALSLGVLVVEAARASGSLITARIAGEIGREVFAIPGSIHSPLSKGCHRLIRDGAKLVESVDDVLAELGAAQLGAAQPGRAGPRPARAARGFDAAPETAAARAGLPAGPAHAADAAHDPGDDALLALMGFDPAHPDTLAERGALADGELAARLLALELDGRVERLPDGRCLRRR